MRKSAITYKFLKTPKNKEHLISFLLDNWILNFQNLLNERQTLIIEKLDGSTVLVKQNESRELELPSDHEEADSKMLVYASHTIHEYYTVYGN